MINNTVSFVKLSFCDQSKINFLKCQLLVVHTLKTFFIAEFENLVKTNLWSKSIDYKENELLPWSFTNEILDSNQNIPEHIMLQEHSSDVCLQEIINSTDFKFARPCIVSMKCWTTFFQYGTGHGYYLTHK